MRNNFYRRTLSFLLALALTVSVLPHAAADSSTVLKPDFAALVETAKNRSPGVIELTEAKYYLKEIFEFAGQYAGYRDVNTGNVGVVDKTGKVIWQPNDESIVDIMPNPNGLLTVMRTDTFGNTNFYPYDIHGKMLCSANIFSNELMNWYDWPSGEQRYLIGTAFQEGTNNRIGWMLLDATGRCVLGEEFGDVCGGVFPRRKDGKWGLCDFNENTLLPYSYDALEFVDENVLLAKQNGAYSLIGRSGNIVAALPDVTDAAVLAPCCGYAAIQKNGLWGFCDAAGRQTVDCRYTEVSTAYYGEDQTECCFGGRINGSWHFIFGDGSIDFDLGPVGEIRWGMVQKQNDHIWRVWQDHKYRLLNDDGAAILPDRADVVFCQDGFAIFADESISQQYAYDVRCYDPQKNLFLQVDAATKFGFTNSALYIVQNDTVSFYSRADGSVMNSIGEITVVGATGDLVLLYKGGPYGGYHYAAADAEGRLLTDYDHDTGGFIGTQICYLHKNGQYHLIDKTGREIMEPVDSLGGYNQNVSPYAWYQRGNKYGFMKFRDMDEPLFDDVIKGAWYAEGADFCALTGLMNGVGGGQFDPQTEMTRAMLVRVLYNLSGTPAPSYGFADVPEGTWYTDAVNWAAANGIVNGVGQNRFDPNAPVTREQMVTILQRYAEKFCEAKGSETALAGFTDAEQTSGYARAAMRWAVEAGIINGVTKTELSPQSTATRAQCATILMRFVRLLAQTNSES